MGGLEQANGELQARAAGFAERNAELEIALEAARTELRMLHDRLVDQPVDSLQDENQALRTSLDELRAEYDEVVRQASQYAEERAARQTAEQRIAELEEHVKNTQERELQARVQSSPGAGALPGGADEHLMTIQDCIAALRINMRAASDETAVMPGDSESVQVVTDAISQAMEQIETARDSLRHLSSIFDLD